MISARTALPDFGRLGFGAVVGVIGLAGLGMGASAVAVAEESKAPVHPMLGAAVTLYQYDVCPFCNKVRAFLDLHKGTHCDQAVELCFQFYCRHSSVR